METPQLWIATKSPRPEHFRRFDGVIFPLRDSAGVLRPPLEGAVLSYSVFGDTLGLRKRPRRAAVALDGRRAVPGNPYDGFAWGWVCPTHPDYFAERLREIETLPPEAFLLLEDFQFPNERYCFCERCRASQARSGLPLPKWRRSVIIERFREIRARHPGPLALTLNPDPWGYPARYGTDPEALGDLAFLHFPVYSLDYRLTYWMDILVPALKGRFPRHRIFVELYAVEPPAQGLLKALFVVSKYSPDAIVLYDYTEKHLEMARLLREDPRIRRLVEAIGSGPFADLAARIRTWGEAA